MVRESFYLSKLDTKIFINKLSIAQEERIEERDGYQRFLDAFTMKDPEKDFPVILRALWEMIDTKDKDKILAYDFVYFDGLERKEYKPTNEVDLLKGIISGAKEVTEIATAMMKTVYSSQPDVKENVKKKVTEALP